MALGGLFSRAKTGATALLDVRASSVGGAYLVPAGQGMRAICYAVRMPIEPREGEDGFAALQRTFASVLAQLSEQGSPELLRRSGSGSVDSVLLAASEPWQNVELGDHATRFEKPITITQSVISSSIARDAGATESDELMEEMVLATSLNGYAVRDPLGKTAQRISMTVFSSSMPAALAESFRSAVRATFHTKELRFVSPQVALFSTIRRLYPFETDFLVLDVSDGHTTAMASLNGTLSMTASIPRGIGALIDSGLRANALSLDTDSQATKNEFFSERMHEAKTAWSADMRGLLQTFTQKAILPKTVFLIAEPDVRDFIGRTLGEVPLRDLWLAVQAPTVVPLSPHAFAALVPSVPEEIDTHLAAGAAYEALRASNAQESS